MTIFKKKLFMKHFFVIVSMEFIYAQIIVIGQSVREYTQPVSKAREN